MFSIGGVGLAQLIARPLHDSYQGGDPIAPYAAVFLLFAVLLIMGLALYFFSQDNTD
jgi:hypothetical protein